MHPVEALILWWGDPHREAKAADVVVKLNAKAVKEKKVCKTVFGTQINVYVHAHI